MWHALGWDYYVCYLNAGTHCVQISSEIGMPDSTDDPSPGRRCLEMGGILVPGDGGCQPTPPIALNFDTMNGYYAWPRVINDQQGNVSTVMSREYEPDAGGRTLPSSGSGSNRRASRGC